jgi:membrane protease subunit (stomatin/prohibitin family)
MSLGAILVGLAIAVVTGAYIARPFRATAASQTDALIEAWIRATPVAAPGAAEAAAAPETRAPASEAVNFCPQCGRQVTADYRFCPGCGALLPCEENVPADGAV